MHPYIPKTGTLRIITVRNNRFHVIAKLPLIAATGSIIKIINLIKKITIFH